jgi:hypothetical protein
MHHSRYRDNTPSKLSSPIPRPRPVTESSAPDTATSPCHRTNALVPRQREAPVDAGIPTDAEIRLLAAAQRSARNRNEFQVDDGEPLWSGFARSCCGLSVSSGSGTETLIPAGVGTRGCR